MRVNQPRDRLDRGGNEGAVDLMLMKLFTQVVQSTLGLLGKMGVLQRNFS